MNGHISYANRLPFEGQSGRRTFPTDNYTAKADNNCVSPFTTPAEFAFLRILRHPEEEPPTRFLLPVAPEGSSILLNPSPSSKEETGHYPCVMKASIANEDVIGRCDGTRTHTLLIKSQLLSQLSFTPINKTG